LNSRGCSALAREATVPSESTTQPRSGDTSGFATDVALALVGTDTVALLATLAAATAIQVAPLRG